MNEIITTAAALAACPIGTTFIDVTEDLLVKVDEDTYAMPEDFGNGELWAYFDTEEVIGAIHSPGSINAPAESHVPFSRFLPMTVHFKPGQDEDEVPLIVSEETFEGVEKGERRAMDLGHHDAFREDGMDDIHVVATRGDHGDAVLITTTTGIELALDSDTIVEIAILKADLIAEEG